MNGTVSKIFYDKNYGFVKADNGIQFFFHKADCLSKFAELQVGDKVSFDSETTEKGPRAYGVEHQ